MFRHSFLWRVGSRTGRWSRRHPCLSAPLILAIVFGVALVTGVLPLLAGIPAQVLCVCEEPSGGYDAIIVMMGDHRARRVEAAAKYYQLGHSRKIHIVQPEAGLYEQYGMMPGEAVLAKNLIRRLGVPEADVLVFQGKDGLRATSSFEEAQIHLDHLLAGGENQTVAPRRVLIVTEWFHTSRARWIFRRVFAGSGITVDAGASGREWVEHWWKDEWAFLGLFDEYLKWIYYLMKY